MNGPTDVLWLVNNEYRKRLSLLMSHMNLLEQIVKAQVMDPKLRANIKRIRATLDEVDADHHEWRHTYYYHPQGGTNGGKRRMVAEPAQVKTAMHAFRLMLDEHLLQFEYIQATMKDLYRPAHNLTRVIKGNDLWDMCLRGIEGMLNFDRFYREQFARHTATEAESGVDVEVA